jgi:hypothetical protein
MYKKVYGQWKWSQGQICWNKWGQGQVICVHRPFPTH